MYLVSRLIGKGETEATGMGKRLDDGGGGASLQREEGGLGVKVGAGGRQGMKVQLPGFQ